MRRIATVVAALLLFAVGTAGAWRGQQLHETTSARNLAFVDAGLTSQVQAQVTQALIEVLTYDYGNPSPTRQAASKLLAGAARSQYDTLFKTLQEKAPGQHLVLRAQVQSAAVKTLTSSTATLLVFLDQSSQRTTDTQPNISAAQLMVDTARIDGACRITGLQLL